MTWRTSCCGTESNVFDAILAVGTGMAAIMVTSAGTSMILVEGIVIYAEKYLGKRYAEGKAEGMAEGKKETNEMWERWYRDLTDAGIDKDDIPPPPSQTQDE